MQGKSTENPYLCNATRILRLLYFRGCPHCCFTYSDANIQTNSEITNNSACIFKIFLEIWLYYKQILR